MFAGVTALQAESRLRQADLAFDAAEVFSEQGGQVSIASASNLAKWTIALSAMIAWCPNDSSGCCPGSDRSC